MVLNPYHMLLAGCLAVALCCGGCESEGKPVSFVEYLGDGVSPPRPNHTITWTHYDGIEDIEDALYLWDGRPVDAGERGLLQILGKIAECPQGSTIVITPRYPYPEEVEITSEPRFYPFVYHIDLLESLIEAKGHKLYYSTVDANNQLIHPRRPD